MSLPVPPVASVHPKTHTLHGDRRNDPYFWLRNRRDPAVIDYLNAENAYAQAYTAGQKALEAQLFEEMKGRMPEDDQSVPFTLHGFRYYSRMEAGKQYPIMCRQQDQVDAPEEILLDLNVMAAGKPFLSLGEFDISPDSRWLALTTDSKGFRQYDLQIKSLQTGKLLKVRRKRVTSVAWALDNATLFYTTEDAVTKRSNQLWRLDIHSGEDTLIHEEEDERFGVDIHLTRSEAYLLYSISSHTTSEVRYLAASTPKGRFKTLARRKQDVEYDVDHHGDHFYLRINDTGPNFRLIRTPVTATTRAHWEEVVPHHEDVCLEDVDLFRDFRVLLLREQGQMQLDITVLASGDSHRITLNEDCYALFGEVNAEFDTHSYRFGYESMTRPETIYDYDVLTRTRTQLKQRQVPSGHDPEQYACERRWIVARDGVQVPVSLVWHKDTPLDGSAPLWLDGYGAYGIASDPYFSGVRLSLLDRGFIFAIAHIRGGGDLGERWHKAGKMRHKMRTFHDFIGIAEALTGPDGIADRNKLVAEGGSAGGLLMGVVANLRPDLFRIILSHVPFVDMLTTMLDDKLPLTVGEYEEWGNPNLPAQYRWMRAYSPYDNLRAQPYPTMLVKTSLHDSQVMYWEPAKYVAKLRTLKTDQHPLLLVTNMDAGHGGASGRYDRLKEAAFDIAFVLGELGVE
ncbi:S9 family peptidase [Burkholderiaceae bacterium DAT-1]|nr:S9 family peptidase [Burkholderiaceae bacterium DAT-1]